MRGGFRGESLILESIMFWFKLGYRSGQSEENILSFEFRRTEDVRVFEGGACVCFCMRVCSQYKNPFFCHKSTLCLSFENKQHAPNNRANQIYKLPLSYDDSTCAISVDSY